MLCQWCLIQESCFTSNRFFLMLLGFAEAAVLSLPQCFLSHDFNAYFNELHWRFFLPSQLYFDSICYPKYPTNYCVKEWQRFLSLLDWMLSHYLASSNAKLIKINNDLEQFYSTLFFCHLCVSHILPLQFRNNIQQAQDGSILDWGNVEKLVSVN